MGGDSGEERLHPPDSRPQSHLLRPVCPLWKTTAQQRAPRWAVAPGVCRSKAGGREGSQPLDGGDPAGQPAVTPSPPRCGRLRALGGGQPAREW